MPINRRILKVRLQNGNHGTACLYARVCFRLSKGTTKQWCLKKPPSDKDGHQLQVINLNKTVIGFKWGVGGWGMWL